MNKYKKTILLFAVVATTCICLALWQWAGFINILRPIGRLAHIQMPATVAAPFSLNFGTLSQPMTVLFMGTDVVYEAQRRGENVKADRVALNGRSDTMMLVFLNPLKMRVSVLNIPRDTEAFIGRWGIQKINSANALGGPDLARATVTGLLNVNIDHYVVMNIQGLVELVNELGGVTVEVPKKMSYMDWTAKLKIDLEPGVHTLTGNQSMGFVRYRHDDLGDIGRVQRQQIFLQAAMRKMMDPRSWPHVPALVKIARSCINTDMSDVQIFECLNYVHGVPKSAFKFVMLPGQFSGNGDWIATTDARTLAVRLADPDQEIVACRRNLSVCVINTTTDPTMGSKVARALSKLGYVTNVGKDQPEVPFTRTRIIAQYGNSADAEMLKNDLGGKGEVVNASVGNLNTSLTVFARSDIDLEKVNLSSVDAPYVPSTGMPQPLVANPAANRPSRPPIGDAPPPIGLNQPDSTTAPFDQNLIETEPSVAATTGTEPGSGVEAGLKEKENELGRETETHDTARENTIPPSGEGAERTERLERGERVERAERTERGERVERTERPERADRPERAERAPRPGESSAEGQPSKSEFPTKSGSSNDGTVSPQSN